MGCFKPQPSHGTKVTVDMRESVGLPAASKKGRRRDLEKKSWGLPKGRAAPGKCLSRAGPGFQLEVTGWISQSHGRKGASRSVADDALLPPFFFHTRGGRNYRWEGTVIQCARANGRPARTIFSWILGVVVAGVLRARTSWLWTPTPTGIGWW